MADSPEIVEANPGVVDVPAPSDQVDPSAADDAILNTGSKSAL